MFTILQLFVYTYLFTLIYLHTGSVGVFYQPTEAGPHNLDVRNNGEHVQGKNYLPQKM